MLENIFLIATAILFLPYGVMCFLKPGTLSKAAGVSAISVTGTTELRAMYGGLQGAIGVLAITAFFNPTLVNPFLVAIITISAGLLLGSSSRSWPHSHHLIHPDFFLKAKTPRSIGRPLRTP